LLANTERQKVALPLGGDFLNRLITAQRVQRHSSFKRFVFAILVSIR
jgi:hypothetical protein